MMKRRMLKKKKMELKIGELSFSSKLPFPEYDQCSYFKTMENHMTPFAEKDMRRSKVLQLTRDEIKSENFDSNPMANFRTMGLYFQYYICPYIYIMCIIVASCTVISIFSLIYIGLLWYMIGGNMTQIYFKRRWVWQILMLTSLSMIVVRSIYISPLVQQFLGTDSERLSAVQRHYNTSTPALRLHSRYSLATLFALDANNGKYLTLNGRSIGADVTIFICSFLMWRTLLSEDFVFVVETAMRKAFSARKKGFILRKLVTEEQKKKRNALKSREKNLQRGTHLTLDNESFNEQEKARPKGRNWSGKKGNWSGKKGNLSSANVSTAMTQSPKKKVFSPMTLLPQVSRRT